MTQPAPLGQARDDSGFTVVEMLVAMVLLAVVALAFFPVVLQSTQAAASDTTLATATRLVSKQMEVIRATPLTACPAPGAEPLGSLVETMTDPRGVELQTWAKFEGTCTPTGLARYVVSVTRSSAPTTAAAALVVLEPRS